MDMVKQLQSEEHNVFARGCAAAAAAAEYQAMLG